MTPPRPRCSSWRRRRPVPLRLRPTLGLAPGPAGGAAAPAAAAQAAGVLDPPAGAAPRTLALRPEFCSIAGGKGARVDGGRSGGGACRGSQPVQPRRRKGASAACLHARGLPGERGARGRPFPQHAGLGEMRGGQTNCASSGGRLPAAPPTGASAAGRRYPVRAGLCHAAWRSTGGHLSVDGTRRSLRVAGLQKLGPTGSH